MEPTGPPKELIENDAVLRNRSFSTGEHLLIWMGILLPGLVSPVAVFFWFMAGYAGGSSVNFWMIGIPVVWIALLLGSCYLAGWINAVKQGTENRNSRAFRSAGLFLLGQLVVTPVLGFGCCMLVAAVMGGGF